MTKPFVKAALFAAAIFGIQQSAHAAIITSSSAFTAATGGSAIVENYGAYSAGTLVPGGSTLGALSYTFSTAGGRGGVITNLYNSISGESLGAKQVAGPLSKSDFFFSGDSFTVIFPFAVTAIGIFDNTVNPIDASITTSAGTAAAHISTYDTSTFDFLGLTTSTGFSSATFTETGSSGYNIAEIEYVRAVPEPASLLIFGSGLLGLGFARRRKRA